MPWTHEHAFTFGDAQDRVFAALTDAEALAAWLADTVEVGPLEVGGGFAWWGRHVPGTPTADDATGQITALVPDQLLAFTWRLMDVPTDVQWRLAAVEGGGTTLTVQHRLHGDLPVTRAHELVDDFWRLAIGNLMLHLAGGEGVVRPDFADHTPTLMLTHRIAATPGRVWEALTDPAQVQAWFNAAAPVIEPREGGAYRVDWHYRVGDRDVTGGPTTILVWQPTQHLVLDWPDWRGDPAVPVQSITFALAPEGDATILTFTHAGFTRAADLSDYPVGWRFFLAALERVATA